MTTQDKLADALPELPKAIFWARNIDGRLELRAGEKPPNRAGGYASPWAAMYDGPSVRDYALQALAEHDAQPATAPVHPCTMGVGCEEAGVCYASANGQPEQCGACPPATAADGAGELPPLPPVDGYDKRVAGHYSAASMHAYARTALASQQESRNGSEGERE